MSFPSLKNRLRDLGFKTTNDIKKDLKGAGKEASNNLIQSLRFDVQGEQVMSLLMYAKDYWKFVDKGRKAGKQPPTKAIEKWLKQKSILTDKKKIKGVAYVIARSIGEKGIKATNIFTDNINKLRKSPLLIEAMKQDVTNNLKQSFTTK